MRIYICDDEAQIRHDLESAIQKLCHRYRIKAFASGTELLQELEKESCDVLLLDIDMPQMSGMDVAKKLCEMEAKPLLIFVTSHDELVYDSFRFHPFGFVRKSFFEQEIEKILKDCEAELESSTRHFTFRFNGKDVRLLLTDILFFEADGNYLKLVASKEEYRIRSTITAVENSLGTYGFIRIHKGFLVNQSAVRMMGADEVQLENGCRLPLGKTYAEEVKKSFMRYMRT